MTQRRIGGVLFVLLWVCSVAPAQEPGVYKERIEPHWSADGERFWYRNDLRDRKREFVLVDAGKGTRRPAFDPVRVAAALSESLGRRVDPDRLPIDALEFEGDSILVLRGPAGFWRWDLQTLDLRPPTPPASPAPAIPTPPTPPAPSGSPTPAVPTPHAAPPASPAPQASAAPTPSLAPNPSLAPSPSTAPQSSPAPTPVPTTNPSPAGASPAPKSSSRPPRRRSRGVNSPDGRWAVVVHDHNLFLRPSAGGPEVPLSTDGKPADAYEPGQFWWSPDSQKLLAFRTEPAEEHKIYTVESSPKDQIQPKLRTLNYPKPGDRIAHPRPVLFHVAGPKPIPLSDALFPNPWDVNDVRWSADSSRCTFVYNQRGHQALRVIAIDADTGDARALIDERSDTFICYSGKYFCQWVGDREILWMSERDGWNHLYLYDAATGRVKNAVTAGRWVVRSVVHVDEEKRQVWFDAGGVRPGQDPYYTHRCRVNFDGTGLTVLTEGDGDHAVRWKPGDAYFIDTWSRVDRPPVHELRRSDTGKLVCELERADADDVLAARGGRWPVPLVAKGRDGSTDIHGVVLLPKDFDPAKRYPVLEDIYAGPQDSYTPKAFRRRYGTMQRFADLGMIVVQCDGMGTSGRSKAFHDVCFKNLRDGGLPDHVAWIKAAAAKFPQLDLGRVGVFGGSAGGQNAMAALLWHNDFYKVAVADCGCHDNRMDKIWWNEQWMGWPVGREYAENSNAVNAHLLKGKLMLIVGEMDSNVDPASTMQVVHALEKADKDFELLIVTGANHGAGETPYGSRRRTEFLVRNLLTPPPAVPSHRPVN